MNMSSPANDSLPPQIASFNTSLFFHTVSEYMHFAFTLTNILLILPLSVFVLYLGHQRRRRQHSVRRAATMSNSDFFTCNMAVMELIGVLGNAVNCLGNFANLPVMSLVGFVTWAFPWNGQMFFPVLTCVDRYLAVVHPITYLRLRQGPQGVTIRNIATGSTWVHCFVGFVFVWFVMVKYPQYQYNFIPNACYMVVLLIIMIFCSLSVLCILIRPRPGEVGIDRVQVDKSKQRAFRTIVVIMGVLLLRFGGSLVCIVVTSSMRVSYSVLYAVMASGVWFNLPSSLVLPLLFLHRAGKLPGCKHNPESG